MDQSRRGMPMGERGPAGPSSDLLAPVHAALAPDPALEERVVARDRCWEGAIFSVDHLEVETPDGSRAWREVVNHRGGAGVVAVRDGCVCLVRQYRVAIGRVTLEIPAGKVDPGETSSHAAARELREEAGLVAEELEPLLVSLGSPGFTGERTEVFLACGLSQSEARPDEGEFLGVVWIEGEAVLRAVREGLIQDAKTVCGVLAARDRGLL